MRLSWLPDVLHDAGVDFVLEWDWDHRYRDFHAEPVGVMLHHTAGRNSLAWIARTSPIAPLSNLYIPKSGVVHVVTSGKANHAGTGLRRVLTRTQEGEPPLGDALDVYGYLGGIGSISGNQHYVGIEVENLGNGADPYPWTQLDATFAATAAILKHLDRPAACTIDHREWTSRKTDMSHRGDHRGAVESYMDVLGGKVASNAKRIKNLENSSNFLEAVVRDFAERIEDLENGQKFQNQILTDLVARLEN